MTTKPRHPLVEEYLTDLQQCAERLPRHEREELMTELRAHVDAGAIEARSEADIRNMLDALGAPEEIIAASGASVNSDDGSSPTGRVALTFGILALVLLPMSYFLFLLSLFVLPFGLTAVVLGVRDRRRLHLAGAPTSTATAATVTGGAAVVIPVLLLALLVGARTVNESPESVPGQDSVVPVPTTLGPDGG